jgi:YVTN family beta-propeller protein
MAPDFKPSEGVRGPSQWSWSAARSVLSSSTNLYLTTDEGFVVLTVLLWGYARRAGIARATATIFLGWDLDPDLRLDFTADGNWVYVTNPVSNTVLAGDLVNLVVAPPISVGTRPTHVAIAQIGPF